jgi:hypothetical protein
MGNRRPAPNPGLPIGFELVLCSSNHLVFAPDVYDVRPAAYENRCRHTRPLGLYAATPQNAPRNRWADPDWPRVLRRKVLAGAG